MKRILVAGTVFAAALIASGAAARAEMAAAMPDQNAADQPDAPDAWAGYAHVGYHLDPHWRMELKGGYRAGAASPAMAPAGSLGLCADPTAGLACGGWQRALGAYSVVANLIFDAMPDNRWVDPFVGVGVGINRFDASPIAMTAPAAGLTQLNPAASSLGYQAIVGLAFRPRDRLRFDLSYRWLAGMERGLNGQPTALNGRFQDQTVAITVRYALSAPRAAIPPAPAFALASPATRLTAPPPHTVVVETPSHPEALSAEAEAAVGQTALSASQGRSSQVVVDGHADTASSADYNRRLSERRAKAMADAMVSLGVPVTAVDLRWNEEGPDAQIGPAPARP
jgi:OOP family OmpA-OmpF porin